MYFTGGYKEKIWQLYFKKSGKFDKLDIIPEEQIDKVVIRECGERLLRIEIPGAIISKTEKRRNFDGDNFLYARETVVAMIEKAVSSLPASMRLKIFDACRPLEFQEMRFNEEYEKTKAANPGLSENSLRALVFVSIFPPNRDPERPPPHSTGGALDLTIVDSQGNEMDMGCKYGEFGERMYTNSNLITPEQRKNRLILLGAMINAGFANFPGEWWHFMYGEREWVAYVKMMTGSKKTAIYGRADLIRGDKDD